MSTTVSTTVSVYKRLVVLYIALQHKMASVCISLTERLLLLLGWDKITHDHRHVYADKKTHRGSAGALRRRNTVAKTSKETRKSTDMFGNAPDLAPVTIVNQTTQAPARASAWGGDAFNTVMTGTV